MLIGENKFIRVKKQKKNFITMIFIVFFVLFFVFVFLFSNTSKNLLSKTKEQFVISGILQKNNNYPLYTHSLTQKNKDILFYLKSSTIDLNKMINTPIILFGNKIGFYDSYPIINAQIIKNTLKKFFLIDNLYIYPKKFFLLDFSQDYNLSASNSINKVKVYYNKEFAFDIKSFVCNKIIEGQNCENIREKLISKFVKTFNSPLGYQFYQFSENYWYVLEADSSVGYIFHVSDEETLLNLSYIFQPIDIKYIIKQKKSKIHEKCLIDKKQKITSFLSSISTIVHDTLLKLSLKIQTHSDKKDVDLDCDILIDINDIDFWIKKKY